MCAGGMYLCMRMMSGRHRPESEADGRDDEEVAALRDEVSSLRAELETRQRQG